MNYDEYEELEETPFRRRNHFVILTLFLIPFVFLITYVALDSTPTYIHFDELTKFSHLETINNVPYDRLILIGDVHGCYDELLALLEKLDHSSTDRVILLGDFISKGPKSMDVLDLAMNENFTAVLGNHELNILSKYQNSQPVMFEDGEAYALDRPGNVKTDEETRLARHLRPEQVEYLASLPLVMDIGSVEHGEGLAMHVGMSLENDVKEQSINEQLAMERDWYKEFNKEMKSRGKKERMVVYYGHNAKYGLNLNKYTKGLDSACVKGGQLSALVLSDGGLTEQLVQIDCPGYI